MVVGEIPIDVDVAVLGGGWAGTAAALAAAGRGKQVVLVDAHGPGGRSFQEIYGPLRALQAAVEPAWRLRAPPFTALHREPFQLDWTTLRGWVQASVQEQVRRLADQMEEAGVEWVHGRGSFAGERELRVESEHGLLRYHFERAVIATGARPDASALRAGKFLTPTDLLALETLPERLAIQGGDELSLELAVLCAKLGVQVTLHMPPGQTLLPGWELDAQEMLRDGLAGLDVTVVAGPPDETDAPTVITGPLAPAIDALGLDAVNVHTDPAGFIRVD
ncbi:MAG: NAD(P)/FAD-dependent oxidoreductase, partial [Caldilineae bacterium]